MNKPHKPEAVKPSALPDISARPAFFGTGVIYPPLLETEAERKATLQRFFELREMGYMSDGTKMTRDEMNER